MTPVETRRQARWRELETRLDRIERDTRQSHKELAGIRDAIKSVMLSLVVITEHLDELDRNRWRPYGDGIRIPRQRHES